MWRNVRDFIMSFLSIFGLFLLEKAFMCHDKPLDQMETVKHGEHESSRSPASVNPIFCKASRLKKAGLSVCEPLQ